MNIDQVRQVFIDYFVQKGHQLVPSSTLVPVNDRSLLFTNAGMVPFKDVILGNETRAYQTAVSAQRCLRAGGKHNDLENVGLTARHHTLFEMLGNFSFGGYFKKEAILMAWELITERYQLDASRLYVTVYSEDQQAYDVWLNDVGLSPERIIKIGTQDNFWSMGDTGPCGPCSEIFYDLGDHISGGLPGTPDEDGDRFVEIWNLVFMQYNRLESGELVELAQKAVDTGMGLERITAVLQGVDNNFDIDVFQKIMRSIESCSEFTMNPVALKVVADHLRAMVFLVADQVYPSNEGRGYVLRRIMRRAMRFGYQDGARGPFLYQSIGQVCEVMNPAMKGLVSMAENITHIIEREEKLFFKTLDQGCQMIEAHLASQNDLDGKLAFQLYDTFGFPLDILKDIAKEKGIIVDEQGFEHHMSQARERSKQASGFQDAHSQKQYGHRTEFIGHMNSQCTVKIQDLILNDDSVQSLDQGQQGAVIIDHTPFYPEGGGQVGDKGLIKTEGVQFVVEHTRRVGSTILHDGYVRKGQLSLGDELEAQVSQEREQTKRHHSATHLLHAALRQVLGDHVVQRGSLVTPQKLRFDFAHFDPLTDTQVLDIERLVNEKVIENMSAQAVIMPLEEAKSEGVMALFDEKYDSNVRVLKFGEFSKELCGGTHVSRSGDIGLFIITSQSSAASGVRRIEAVTGILALKYLHTYRARIHALSHIMKIDESMLEQKATALLGQAKEQSKLKKADIDIQALLEKALTISGVKVVYVALSIDVKQMRQLCDDIREQSQKALVFIRANQPSGAFIACVSGPIKEKFDLKSILGQLNESTELTLRFGGNDLLVQGKVEGDAQLNQRALVEVLENL
ncbi:alanine--tRNA ligase [Gammaproteobacteria bacterium]|nr:alanine--tRNA ligase [Gammaproteobacteria bacterium]